MDTRVHLVLRTLGKVWPEEAAGLTPPTSAHLPKDHCAEVTGVEFEGQLPSGAEFGGDVDF